MPEKNNGGRGLERRVRFLVLFAAAIATVMIFAWRSQAKQDDRIGRNETAVAVIDARLESIGEKLDEIRDILKAHQGPGASASGTSWQEDGGGRRMTREQTSLSLPPRTERTQP